MLPDDHYSIIIIIMVIFKCSGDSCLDEHLLKLRRLSIWAESCVAEQVFGGQHVSVMFPFFHDGIVSGDNGRIVCLFERQAVL